MMARLFLVVAALAFAPATVLAQERITDFNVEIDVQKDGDILVTESIVVVAKGRQIKRGIFRDLPRYYLKGERKLPYSYDVRRVERNGVREPYRIERTGNAFRVRIGKADVYLVNRTHTYKIVYVVKNQVRYFDAYDEIYWNATGTYWAFPIDRARVQVALLGKADALREAAYTGAQGSLDQNYEYAFRNGVHEFASTSRLQRREGITVSVGFEKGVVDPPSLSDAQAEWWALNASRVVLVLALLGLSLLYWATWRRVGRDPPKGPVFARYEPPADYSPSAVHHVYYRGFSEHDAFIATLMDLATKGRIHIDVESGGKTKITHLKTGDQSAVAEVEEDLLESLCSPGQSFIFGDEYNSTLIHVYARYKKNIAHIYGDSYFRWNRGFLVVATLFSGLTALLAIKLAVEWTAFHTGAVLALATMAVAASYFLPAPTRKGQAIRTEIEGFRLYLKTAEQLHLNSVDIGADAPPPMTVERYERFLPNAIALGVEKPWTAHFEKLMPKEAAEYTPVWTDAYGGRGRSLSSLNSALVSGISSAVSSSFPQSSSSSGSGGGGFSGGGGGGGGGGGW